MSRHSCRAYYLDDRLQTSKQPFKGDGAQFYLTTYLYDSAGRKTSQDTKLVDGNNTLIGTDPGAQTFTYYNDDRGNTQTGRGGSGTITQQYDPAGNAKTATDSTGGGSTITSSFYLDSQPRTVDNGTKTNKYHLRRFRPDRGPSRRHRCRRRHRLDHDV